MTALIISVSSGGKCSKYSGAIENALEKLTGEKVKVSGSSRTDTGVHAERRLSVSIPAGSPIEGVWFTD